LFDDATHGLLRVASLVVAGAEVSVGLLVGEHVPDRDDDGVFDRDQRLQRSGPPGERSVTRLE